MWCSSPASEGKLCSNPRRPGIRLIHNALMQLRDALQYQQERGQNVAMLNLDLEKAYDQGKNRPERCLDPVPNGN
ncbi:hypothetical protein Y1Q_0001664 [Alligator mississippiensis]|uniref:Reverse transcriptase domain-containing protein n=1 Tax=Alligator mississippiensis TaxID=8496 RepID=A0A151MAE7_ALLMI|nr:hypothetical protein Y1Q_0001664 [Alligator mississippiensis]